MTALPFSRSFKTPIQWQTVLFVAAGGCGLFLVAFWPSLPALGPRPVLVAVLGTVVSFWALGQYDVIWHRTTGTGVAARQAQRSGMAAIAIGQAVGASSLSSAIVRRLTLPALQHVAIAQVSAGVALSFTACWALLALIAISTAGDTALFHAPDPVLLLALGGGIGVMLVRLARQNMIRLRDALTLLGCSVLDLGAAGLALYMLLPAGIDMPFWAFLGVFVLAMGAGILSHLPCGIGVFELVLFALLPHSDGAALMGSVVVFRVIYYAAPFALATAWVLACCVDAYGARALTAPPPSTPASWGLAAQSGTILSTRAGAFHTAQTPFGLIAIGDPVGARPEMLRSLALQCAAMPAIYKCSARVALQLRQAGWQVLAVAHDASVTPTTWTRAGRAKQGLRRKLRQAADLGVDVRPADGPLPMDAMAGIAADWARTHGGEMGFSMGMFDPDYVRQQKVFLIYRDDKLCGFVTFHCGPHDWTLDLMRHDATMPSGAMHLAIATAIEAAGAHNVPRLSLAAVPNADGPLVRFCKGRAGLVQFKRAFDPVWQPLYHAAPYTLALWATGLGVAWAIHRPFARLRLRVLSHPAICELSFDVLHGKRLPQTDAATQSAVTPRQRTDHHDERTFQTT